MILGGKSAIIIPFYIRRCVGMADEGDSKSLVLITRVGSTPTTGIKRQPRIERFWAAFLFLSPASGSFSHFCLLREDPDDGIGRRYLTGEIQMCINVACCVDVTVTEPLLDFLQAHAIGIEQTGAGRGNGYASSGVRPENPGNAGSGNRVESAFPSGLHRYSQDNRCNSFCRRPSDSAPAPFSFY